MTSAFGTHSLLLSERFDGISDSINWLGVQHLFDTGGPARRGIGSIRAQNEARCDTIQLLWSRARWASRILEVSPGSSFAFV
jgi:hypothetical protein